MKKDLLRTTMLAAGFLAVVAILCSQSFYYNRLAKEQVKTEQAGDKQQPTIVQAPADAIPGHSVQVDDSSAFHFIADLFEAEEEPELPSIPAERIGHFLEVLFRTLIAPNAP